MPNRTTAATLAALPTTPSAVAALLTTLLTTPAPATAQVLSDGQLKPLVARVEAGVLERAKLAQVMVDKIFSFSELGQQEIETSAYITGILEDNGFAIEHAPVGIPTAWFARWGSGEPVISFGSDIDGIPKASQKPGVAYHDPLVPGAPGHGEGHNSGQAVNVVAALALKEVMEAEGIQGTLVLWPGVAEEQLGSKAWYVRDGYMEDIDVTLFTHVSSNLSVSWGQGSGTGLVSVEFTFEGEAAHGAGSPWRGRSALDAVELMNVAWNFRREHLHPNQRSHYVISDGGDQPNVVPPSASVWYFIREMDYEGIKRNFDTAIRIAEGAAMMTDTEMSYRIIGAAWPRHFNRVVAETMYEHIQDVGLPEWTDDDHDFASAVQQSVGSVASGMPTSLSQLGTPGPRRSGGSDDIGDISWNVPTVTLRFPSNVPGLPGHHWSSAMAMATPIAHKGAVAGARVLARTALQLFAQPELVEEAWTYFREDQSAGVEYIPFIGPEDPPPIDLNREIMDMYRPLLKQFYYDETRFESYLEQLGIKYPTLTRPISEDDR
ncbi:MAG: amidohydrolase [Gemmatimonadota bacterium]|nr:amidohydrolase [Gemmatimonadota bacterium]